MKTKIDFNDVRVQAYIQNYGLRGKAAYEAATCVEESVHPIYVLPECEKKPRQIGSCVILEIKGQVFLLSAAHVFEPIGSYAVLVGCGATLHAVTGDRFSSKQGPSGTHIDDVVDAAVLHITCEVPVEIRSAALSLDHIDLDPPGSKPEFHVAVGYRASQSKRSNKQLSSKSDMYPSCEYLPSKYSQINLDRAKHIALVFEDELFVDSRWQPAPGLKGMSGGAIFRIAGLSPYPDVSQPAVSVVRLTAIITERRAKKNEALPILVGARIGFHLGLIQHYLSELLADH